MANLNTPNIGSTAPSAETLPAFQPVPLNHPDVEAVVDAVVADTGVAPQITGAVVSTLGDGEKETLHSHWPDHYFAVCRTPIRGVALDAEGNVLKQIAFGAGDVIAFNPLPENTPHRLLLNTNGNPAAISYVSYTLPAGTPYPQPGVHSTI
jgi:hypothetical protein